MIHIIITLILSLHAHHPAPTPPVGAGGYGAPTVIPACQYEDGNGDDGPYPCRWDGATMGNGIGDSYIVTGPDQF